MLISMADAVAKEERFSPKAAELCVQVMKWSGRTALVVFTGLEGRECFKMGIGNL